MIVLKTPLSRFENLPDYPFDAHYLDVEAGLTMHYLDEGPRDGQVILMLHGEPSWSYLYRFMIPVCVKAGYRVIAPDLIGFGKSDKPTAISDYTYNKHLTWLLTLIDALEIRTSTLVCQDWGGLLGLRLAGSYADLFSRIVVGNSALPTGQHKMPSIFRVWRVFARFSPWFPIARIVEAGCFKKFDASLKRAYNAPFPSAKYKAGARAFPRLVPIKSDTYDAQQNQLAWSNLCQWQRPFLTCFSNGDPIMRGMDRLMQKHIPGCLNQNHRIIKGGHFLQEDNGPEFAVAINQFISDNPI